MEIGYARVSRGDSQDIDPQLRALRDAGCDPIYQEEASGGRADRPELARAIGALKSGDVFVVWKLDRLSRSLRDLLFTLEAITAAGAGFRSVTEAIDTTTAPGRLMTQMLGAFAEFERAMIRERTMNGLAHARKAGRHLGRRPSLNGQQRAEIIAKAESGVTAYVDGSLLQDMRRYFDRLRSYVRPLGATTRSLAKMVSAAWVLNTKTAF